MPQSDNHWARRIYLLQADDLNALVIHVFMFPSWTTAMQIHILDVKSSTLSTKLLETHHSTMVPSENSKFKFKILFQSASSRHYMASIEIFKTVEASEMKTTVIN